MATTSKDGQKTGFNRLVAPFTDLFGLSRPVAVGTVIFLGLLVALAVFWFFHSAPPKTLTITAGPPDSSYQTNAERYRIILASNGVTLRILSSQGSLENLQRLQDKTFPVDIGFVQSGITNAEKASERNVISLGSITYQPLMVFYRGTNQMTMLSQLKGKHLAIGRAGSGTRSLALTLLKLNGIEPGGDTTLSDLEAGAASKTLLDGSIDAVFLMGDSASPQVLRELLRNPDIELMSFSQADGYTRRISYLNKLEMPMGSIDFGKNIPDQDTHLIGPTVELLARPDLHPALVDLLLEAAREVHGNASLFKRRGEFPAALEQDHPISAEAQRFYKSGKSFLYRNLPFWLASLLNRILVAFVPLVVIAIPGVRMIPKLYQWRIRLHIYRWYRALLVVERELLRSTPPPEKKKELLARLDEIDEAVNKMKVPASFANQFYNLRGDIGFVRTRLTGVPDPAQRTNKNPG